ncbi:hypothetical protein H8356DRAFT_1422269 [Neocallimastix lanati (nom. inval.)]|nr:hypothetical protein H8356DRAFT_1422269 [Neocallimastix sp. JGI-2020a]
MENTTNNVLICNEKKNGDFIETLNNKCGVIFENTFYKIDNVPYCEQHYKNSL